MKENLSLKRMKVIMVEDEEEIKKQQIITEILKWADTPPPKPWCIRIFFKLQLASIWEGGASWL